MRHFIEPNSFSLDEQLRLLNLADRMEADPAPYAHLCDGRILATLFYEPSTRTRLSFESPILTGVGMPIWKAAKMRAFSKHGSATGFVWNATFSPKECLYLCSKKAPCGAFLFGIAPHISILADTYR